jgi:hypothetical protein
MSHVATLVLGANHSPSQQNPTVVSKQGTTVSSGKEEGWVRGDGCCPEPKPATPTTKQLLPSSFLEMASQWLPT